MSMRRRNAARHFGGAEPWIALFQQPAARRKRRASIALCAALVLTASAAAQSRCVGAISTRTCARSTWTTNRRSSAGSGPSRPVPRPRAQRWACCPRASTPPWTTPTGIRARASGLAWCAMPARPLSSSSRAAPSGTPCPLYAKSCSSSWPVPTTAQLRSRRASRPWAQAPRTTPPNAWRARAIAILGELDCDEGVAALVELTRVLPPPARALAAASLPANARSRRAVARLVERGFEPDPGSTRTPDDVLAAVLPLHGRLLADEHAGAGFERDARERSALVLGLRHPAVEVRIASARAFERLLGRLRELGEADRAREVLSALATQGIDARVAHYHRARLAFWPGADPAAALLAARDLALAPENRGWFGG